MEQDGARRKSRGRVGVRGNVLVLGAQTVVQREFVGDIPRVLDEEPDIVAVDVTLGDEPFARNRTVAAYAVVAEGAGLSGKCPPPEQQHTVALLARIDVVAD